MEEWFMNNSFNICMNYGEDKHTICIDECEEVVIDGDVIEIYTTVGNFIFKGKAEFTEADDYPVVIKTKDGEILIAA